MNILALRMPSYTAAIRVPITHTHWILTFVDYSAAFGRTLVSCYVIFQAHYILHFVTKSLNAKNRYFRSALI